jgi:hypothetical protein
VTGPDAVGSAPAPEAPGWHPGLAEAFAGLDRAGVPWCLLRPPATTGDVDLLVAREERGRAGRCLAALGFARIPYGGTPDAFHLRYDAGADRWLHLHVTSEVSFGAGYRFRTGAADACLDRRVRRGPAWYLRPDDEFWATLLHAVLDEGTLAARHAERLAELAAAVARQPDGGTGGPVVAALGAHLPTPEDAGRLVHRAAAGQERELLAAARQAADRWRAAVGGGPLPRRAGRLLRRAADLPGAWRRRGLSVALLGSDGAGRAALAAGVAEHFFLPVSPVQPDPRAAAPGEDLPSRARRWWRLAAARRRQARGDLVLVDGCADGGPASVGGPPAVPDRTARCPRAGLTLVLDPPGGAASAREEQRHPMPRVEVLDATRPADLVRRDAVARIWARYAARWGAAPARPVR